MTRDKGTGEKVVINPIPNYSGHTNISVHRLSIFKSR